MKDFPCKCGHTKERHKITEAKEFVCMGCWFDKLTNNRYEQDKSWHKFTPDNLKYFEEKYNQQILDKYRSKI